MVDINNRVTRKLKDIKNIKKKLARARKKAKVKGLLEPVEEELVSDLVTGPTDIE